MKPLRPLVALAAVVAATLALTHSAPTPRPPPRAHAAPRHASPPAPAAPAPGATSPATRHVFTLDTALRLDASSTRSDALTVRLTGTLEAVALTPEVSALRLRDPSITLSQPGREDVSPAARAQLERSIARPFYVERAPGGAVRAIRQPDDLDPLLAGCQRYLAAALQVTPAPAADSPRWTAREVDASGACDAAYARGPRGEVTRVRSGWTPSRHRPVGAASARVVGSSRATIRLSPDQAVESIEARDEVRSDVGEGLSARSETRLTARRGPDGEALDGAGLRAHLARMGALRVAALDESAESPAAAEGRDRRLVAGASLATLRAAVEDVAEGAALSAASVGAIRRMSALFRLDPRAADEAARAVIEGARPAEAVALTAALGDLGTPAAQRALAAVAGSPRVEVGLRAQAVTSLALTERPTPESLDALERLSAPAEPAEVRSAATLGEGAAVHAARAAGTPAEGAFASLVERLARATDAGEAVLLLDALGNTGDPRVVAVAERLLRHPSADVREAAVCAVRLVEGGEAVSFLAARMREPGDAAQRIGAVRALGFRALEAFEAPLAALVQGDEVLDVRSRAVAMLGARVRQSPLAAELLLRVAEGEADADLRARARSWLQQLDGA